MKDTIKLKLHELAKAVFRGKYINIYNNLVEKYYTNNLTSTLEKLKRRATKSNKMGKWK